MCRIGGRLGSVVARLHGVIVEIPPLLCLLSNTDRDPVRGQCQAGGLTGAVAS
jgi:hypothetical protein